MCLHVYVLMRTHACVLTDPCFWDREEYRLLLSTLAAHSVAVLKHVCSALREALIGMFD